ncbi:MAG: penicillin acylase family protein, partial [Chitinophagaceae bacterium]
MRIASLLISGIFTLLLIIVFDTTSMLPAPLGKLLSPQHGIWQNAEPADEDFTENFHFPGMRGKAAVYFDDRLVPHIFADSDADAFFVQGFIHAKFRLWQMEFQTHAAAGRLTEILGAKSGTTDLLNVADRYFRRLGMTYAAERSLALSDADPITKLSTD